MPDISNVCAHCPGDDSPIKNHIACATCPSEYGFSCRVKERTSHVLDRECIRKAEGIPMIIEVLIPVPLRLAGRMREYRFHPVFKIQLWHYPSMICHPAIDRLFANGRQH